MDTIFMNLKIVRFLILIDCYLILLIKQNQTEGMNIMHGQILAFTILKNIKKSCNNKTFEISASSWNNEFNLSDGS